MPFLPQLLLWPLRKAAIIPTVALGVVSFAAFVGSADLAAMTTRLVFAPPKPADRRKYSSLVATGVSAGLTGTIVIVREVLMKPKVPPAPTLPVDGTQPWAVRLRNATTISTHVLKHYPYRFRFFTVFVAGTAAGVAYVLAEWGYNRPAPTAKPAAPLPAAPDTVDATTAAQGGDVGVPVEAEPVSSTAPAPATAAASVEGEAEDDRFESEAEFKARYFEGQGVAGVIEGAKSLRASGITIAGRKLV